MKKYLFLYLSFPALAFAQTGQRFYVRPTALGQNNGGLLGYVEEYHSIGLSEANYQACVEAFRTLGRYRVG